MILFAAGFVVGVIATLAFLWWLCGGPEDIGMERT